MATTTATLIEPGDHPGAERRGAAMSALRARRRAGVLAVWAVRLLALSPFVFMAPEFILAILGHAHATDNIVISSNDVLGNGALLTFMGMLAVTPLHTVTGWQWHRVLRRDLGRAMFAIAALDLILAATLSAIRFPGGLMTRLGGHGFLFAGTLSTLLVLPVALTSSRASQRWLGRHWAVLHRLVYATWVTILVHLAFLFAFRTLFIDALVMSTPLALLRVPRVRARWTASRRGRSARLVRGGLALILLAIFVTGLVPFIIEYVNVGVEAFVQAPH